MIPSHEYGAKASHLSSLGLEIDQRIYLVYVPFITVQLDCCVPSQSVQDTVGSITPRFYPRCL